MHDETTDLMNTLTFTLGVIASSEGHHRQRLMDTYGEAKALAAGIEGSVQAGGEMTL